jgi:hypothetical protein
MLIFGIMVSKSTDSHKEAISNQEGNGKVKLIREPTIARKVTYKILELENGDTFIISNSLVETVHIGDSVYKIKGEEFYNLLDFETKEIRKIDM